MYFRRVVRVFLTNLTLKPVLIRKHLSSLLQLQVTAKKQPAVNGRDSLQPQGIRNIVTFVSMIATFEPPMIALIEPLGSAQKAVSNSLQSDGF